MLSGRCPQCQTKYYADHESTLQPDTPNTWSRCYLNSAKYLKIGQQLWVDQIFSKAVLNGAYRFHGSSSAFAEFWSDSSWATQDTSSKKVTHQQALIQKSVQKVADSSDHILELPDGLKIAEVTKQAFAILGDEGIIKCADGHSCSGCTQSFKKIVDRITEEDPAALLGVDKSGVVPALTGEDADLAVQDAAQARFNANNAMGCDGVVVTITSLPLHPGRHHGETCDVSPDREPRVRLPLVENIFLVDILLRPHQLPHHHMMSFLSCCNHHDSDQSSITSPVTAFGRQMSSTATLM